MSGAPHPPRLGPEDVRRIAGLARLAISDDEAARFAAELDPVLAHLASLRAAGEADTPPRDAALDLGRSCDLDSLRGDVPRAGLPRDDALAAAPDTLDGAFRVPRVAPDDRG